MQVSAHRIATVLADERTALLVCVSGVAVCATVLVGLCADVMFNAQPFAVIENLVVDQAMRSQGVGELLLDAVEQFCRRHDCSKMMLLSSAQRTEAHRFFERAGFLGSVKQGYVKYRRDFAR